MMAAWLKAAVPVATAAVGGALLLTAPSGASGTAAWIDDPLSGTTVAPGAVAVLVHASSDKALTEIQLLVDGAVVATDTSLEPNGLLRLASFTWQAAAGEHVLAARASGALSAKVHVLVGSASTPAPVPSIAPTKSATPTVSPTPTVQATASPTARATTASASPTRSPAPKPTKTTRPPPAVANVVLSSHTAETKPCSDSTNPGSVTVTAHVTGTVDRIVVSFTGATPNATLNLTSSGGGTWSGTIAASQLSDGVDSNDEYAATTPHYNDFDVTATAYDGVVQASGSGGSLRIYTSSCKE